MPPTLSLERSAGDPRTFDELVTQARMNGVALAAASFCMRTGQLPVGYAEMIQASASSSTPPSYCEVESDLLADAWGTDIRYVVSGETIDIRSAGADGVFGTADDISLPTASDALAEPVDVEAECGRRESARGW